MNLKQKKAAHLAGECEDTITDETISIKKQKKTILIKENNSCKPYVASSISFLLTRATLTGLFICFYVNSWSKNDLPY